MAALDFPSNPTNGQTYENFVYDSSITAWRNQGSPSGLAGQVVALGNSTGLKTVAPSSVTIATGSGSYNSLGVVSFSGATSVTINNVFTSAYKNYKFFITLNGVTDGSTVINMRLTTGGADHISNYNWSGYRSLSGTPNLSAQEGNGAAYWKLAEISSGSPQSAIVGDIQDPFNVAYTFAHYTSHGFNGSYMTTYGISARHFVGSSYDGLKIYPALGNFSGTIQVLGYNG